MPKSRRLVLAALLAAALLTVGVWHGPAGWPTASADTYTVREGDTLSEIAYRLQVGVSVLQALNPQIESPNSIYVGQIIQIPDNASAIERPPGSERSDESGPKSQTDPKPQPTADEPPPTLLYLIQAGDYLGEIADRFNTDVETIRSLNPGLDPNRIFAGRSIVVPRSATTNPSRQSLNAGVRVTEPAQPLRQFVEYVVKPGDSPLAIAEHAGVTLEDLIQANPLTDFDAMIHPGDILYIPIPDHLAPALDPEDDTGTLTARYTVRVGDIASSIARRHGVSLDRLRQLNGGADLNIIQPGQTLIVPWTGETLSAPLGTAAAVEVRRRTHRVRAGETFSGIALTYGLSLEELRAVNEALPRDLLFVGQLLNLPGTIDPPVVARESTLWDADLVQYAAATLGVTPHTLLANHGGIEPDQWLEAGTSWRLPIREGLLVTVQPGDTLRGIASRNGVNMDAILADPAHGVDDPNAIVIGQEIIIPLAIPDFAWPAQGELTDPFGLCRSWDCSYRHKGLDVALDIYEPIVASADGVVTFVGGDALLGLGWYVEIDHGNGWLTVYAHLVEFEVWQGQTVSQGDVIGYNGNTGYSTGPHLHFEVQHNDWYIDPLVVLP